MHNFFDTYQHAVNYSLSFFEYSSIAKMLAIHRNIVAGLESYLSYNILLKITLFAPLAIYLFISSFLVLVFGVASIFAYIPFLFFKAGNLLLDYVTNESDRRRYGGFNFFEIILLVPIMLYIIDFISLLIIAIPSFLGLADYFDFPGYIKGMRVNLTILRGISSFCEFDILAKIIAAPFIFVTLCLALVALFFDMSGIIATFIPHQCFKIGDYFLEVCLKMSKPEKYQANFFTLAFFPLFIYAISTVAATFLVAPIMAAVLIAS